MKDELILMSHGSGGLMSQRLIEGLFKQHWHNQYLDQMLDGAVLTVPEGRLAMSTDSFVITPIFFPGGDIGKLAICGTVNDLLACGAAPAYLTVGMIIEEGLPLEDLRTIVASMAETARQAGVAIVSGDTKVVEKGGADRIFINTTGIGMIHAGLDYHPGRISTGDAIIVTGNVGDHGLAVLAQREGLSFSTPAFSDCAPLNAIAAVAAGFGSQVRCMRDPTRGGLATVLNELAVQSGCSMLIREADIPVSAAVQGACDMLGMDPLFMANEGKFVIVAAAEAADSLVVGLRATEEGRHAAIIGEVTTGIQGLVRMMTPLRAERILGMLEGEHLPRIC